MPDRPIPRSRGQGPGAGGQADPHLLPHRRQEIGAGGLPQLSGRVAGRRFQDPVRMQGRRAVRRRFPVLRHQRRKGTPARPGRCHVRRQVLRGAGQEGSARRRYLRVPGRDGRWLQPHHAGVPASARNQADADGQVQVLDMAAMQKSLAESGRVAVYGVYFDTDKAEVKPESKAALDEMGKLLNANPNLKVYVVGHTDNQGTLAGNLDLSQKRADAVVKALESGYKIPAARCRRAAWPRWRRWPPTTPRPAARRTAALSWSASDDTPPRHGPVIKSPGTSRFRGFMPARGGLRPPAAGAARRAGCRRAGSSPPRSACRCAAARSRPAWNRPCG